MSPKSSKQELLLVLMAVAMGTLLRFSHIDNLAVEHFDEGIYSSATWYDATAGEPWPMRHLYAPPLLPKTIQLLSAIPGLQQAAPFLPSLLLGALTIVVLWWLARTMFGQAAGLFMVFIVAFSDFHILFSRMAMTDVPVLFWISLSVTIALKGISGRSVQTMAIAGICCGIGWWTKYSGWLPLAIVASGSGAWWIVSGRRTMSLAVQLKLLVVMAAAAFVAWLPWLWMLQDVGGYKAVADNHAGYFEGLAGWQSRLASHMLVLYHFDSWLGAGAIGIGVLAAGSRRWIELKRSTWNARRNTSAVSGDNSATSPTAESVSEGIAAASLPPDFPSSAVLGRFVVAAITLAMLATGTGGTAILACIAIGGLMGMFLSPNHVRSASLPQLESDRTSASAIDPTLAAFVALAWFSGMLLTTPMYQAYPRLSLPLLAGIWLAASGGMAWWIESTLNIQRNGEEASLSSGAMLLKRAVTGLVAGAVVLTFMRSNDSKEPVIWQPRTSLRDASWAIADTVLKHASGNLVVEIEPLETDDSGSITPEPEWNERDAEGKLLPEPTSYQRMLEKVTPAFDSSTPLTTDTMPNCVVYGFGEPSVLSHLHNAGLTVAPVQDVEFGSSTLGGKPLPTYLVLGPYALRTPGLMNDWAAAQYRFEHICDIWYFESDIVLFNLFAPGWVLQQPECQIQKLELYHLKPQELLP